MKKTIREWFNELEEPYRTQAIENTSESDLFFAYDISLSEALSGAFIWAHSKQGSDYWNNLYELLKK